MRRNSNSNRYFSSTLRRVVTRFTAIAVLLVLQSACFAQPARAVYSVSGDKILKNGLEFVIHGININGPGIENRHKVTQDAALIADIWKFNLVRVNCKLEKVKTDPKNASTLDEIVQEFSNRGLAIVIAPRDHLDGYYEDPPKPEKSPSLSDLVAWYKDVAARYKSYSNVWFEVQAGPGNREERTIPGQFLFTHETVIKTIRSEVGAQNIIVCDGYGHGQDDGNLGALFAPDSASSVLSLGPDLVKTYTNIAFAFSCMESWNPGGAVKLNDYLDRVRAKGLAIFVSEYGLHSWADSSYATEAVLAAGKARKLGHCAFQWTPYDRSALCCTDYHDGGWDIDKTDGTRPNNLSWLGDRVWIDNHIEPFHGPALDRTNWTASSFTGDKPKDGRLNLPDQVLANYVTQEETWSSGIGQQPGQWFQVDMGSKRTFTRVLIDTRSFCTEYPHGYELYVSNDGSNWGTPIARGKNEQSVLRISFPVQSARYIKIVETEKHWRPWHVGTFEVYAPFGAPNTLAATTVKEALLDTHGWLATAQPTTWYDLQMPLRPRQGEWDRATSNKKIVPGDYYQLDMQQVKKFHKIVLNSGRFVNDYPRGYEVYVSQNGADWGKPVAAGRGAPITTIVFPTVSARYLRIVETKPTTSEWAITECRVYGDAVAGQVALTTTK